MKPSRCGGYIRIHGTTPASEERYEHLSIGCIAMDDGTGTFGVAVARMSPEISLKCPDENELASRLSERAVDERLTARRVERIRDLENALRRIEVMDYGVCEACGEPIPLLRLLASPSVRYCVACQQELEEEERTVVVTGSFEAPRPRRTTPPRPVTPPMPFFLPRRRQAIH